jgi:glutaredoxin
MKVVVLYTMDGCPFCTMIKEEFKKNDIIYLERDIDEYEEEYDEFVKVVDNDFVPAIMLITIDEDNNPHNIKYLAPDRDFNDIYEGAEIVKEYMLQ